MTKDHLLAFDLGTTGNKAILLDTSTGVVVDAVTTRYETDYLPGGGAEQRPEDWWDAVVVASRAIVARNPGCVARIAAIGCTGMMNGVVLVDATGQSMRPSIIHADSRSTAQVDILIDRVGAKSIQTATSNRPDCRLSLSKVMWLQENEPGAIRSAAWVVQAKDYLTGRLTGRPGVTDPSDASLTGVFDVRGRKWLTDLWQEAGLPDRLLPEVVPSTGIVGKLSAESAAALGLPDGIPVVAGGGDGPCATAGSGAGLGEAYHYLGGSSWIGFDADAPVDDDRLSHYCSLDDRVTVFGTVQSAGSSVEWFTRLAGELLDHTVGATLAESSSGRRQAPLSQGGTTGPGEGLGVRASERLGVRASEGLGVRHSLESSARAVPPGSDRLFFLPYLQGERAPLWDADARGAFIGLSSIHGSGHLYRAVLEGTAYALRSILDVFAQNGHPLAELRQLGGGATSFLWQDILAAVLARRIHSIRGAGHATCLGAAMAAGVGVCIYPSIAEAGRRLTSIDSTAEASADLIGAYRAYYEYYRTLYPALSNRFAALAEL